MRNSLLLILAALAGATGTLFAVYLMGLGYAVVAVVTAAFAALIIDETRTPPLAY